MSFYVSSFSVAILQIVAVTDVVAVAVAVAVLSCVSSLSFYVSSFSVAILQIVAVTDVVAVAVAVAAAARVVVIWTINLDHSWNRMKIVYSPSLLVVSTTKMAAEAAPAVLSTA